MEVMKFSSSLLDSKLMFGVNVAPKFCSCRGLLMKASYSSTSYDATRSVSKKNFLVDTFSYRINGTNHHTSLYFRDKWVLDASDDEYGGVLVNPERLPSNPDKFTFVLRASLSHWKVKGKKGVWLKLPLEKCDLVPVAVKEGFQYHHAERGYVMMTYWIPEEPCMLPSNASHQVGVLVVQEKHSMPALSGLWKIPTGFIFEWMPLVEFVEQPLIQGDDMFKKIIDIFIARLGKRYCGLSVHQLVSKFDDKLSTV